MQRRIAGEWNPCIFSIVSHLQVSSSDIVWFNCNLSVAIPVCSTLAPLKMKLLLSFLLLTAFLAQSQTMADKARKLYDEKKYPEVHNLLKGIEENNAEYAVAQYYLGRLAYDQKDYDNAADFFEEATDAKGGQVAEYYNWLGNTYGTIAQNANIFRQGMLAPKMKSAWEKAIALDPKNMDARFSLISYYTQAPGIMGGSFEKAKEMSLQIGLMNPVQGHRSLGNILVQEKKFEAAEKEYLEMVKMDPNFSPVLANFYFVQQKYDKAFNMFEEALRQNPQDMASTYQIGKASALSGQRLDLGEECLKKYLNYAPKQNEPSHAGANMRLAQIYEKNGKKADAKQMFETALKLDNSLKEAREGLVRVSK